MTTKRISVAFLVLAILGASTLTWYTTVPFFVASGSDALVEIYAPSVFNRVVTLLFVSAAWIASTLAPMVAWKRWTLRVAGLVALSLCTHLVVFKTKRGILEEHWLNVRMDRVSYDRSEGLVQDWRVRRRTFGVDFVHRRDHESRFVFTGVPPWRVDIEPTLQANSLRSSDGS